MICSYKTNVPLIEVSLFQSVLIEGFHYSQVSGLKLKFPYGTTVFGISILHVCINVHGYGFPFQPMQS